MSVNLKPRNISGVMFFRIGDVVIKDYVEMEDLELVIDQVIAGERGWA